MLPTPRLTVVACVAVAPVAVTNTANSSPEGVNRDALMVIVELPPTVSVLGLNEAVTPGGSPLALSEIDCADPFVRAVVMVVVPLRPWGTLSVLGLALTEKSLAPITVSVMDMVKVVEVPVHLRLIV